MPGNLTSPRAGEPLRASWAGEITRRVNELGGMTPSHGLVRDGALGYGVQPLPGNRRERRPAPDMATAFELGSDGYLKNCYYLYAGILCQIDDQSEASEYGINVLQTPGFTVLAINYATVNSNGVTATISNFPTLADIKAAQLSETSGIIPLYLNMADEDALYGPDGGIRNVPLKYIIDLRTMPMFQGVEVLADGTRGGADD